MTEAVSEKMTKQELFWGFFVKYHIDVKSFCNAADMGSWHSVLQLRGSLTNTPLSELKDRLEDYLEAAFHYGEIVGFTEALEMAYDLGLVKDYLERPEVLDRLQKLAFEVFWLDLRFERLRLRRNESLARKTARLSYAFYRLLQKALKAAKAQR